YGVTPLSAPFDASSAAVSLSTADTIPARILVPSGVAATTMIMMMIAATTTTPYSSRNVFIGLFSFFFYLFCARAAAPGRPPVLAGTYGVTLVFPPFELLSAVVSLLTADVIPLRMLVPSGVAATTIIMMMIAATTTTPYSSRNVFMGLFLLSQFFLPAAGLVSAAALNMEDRSAPPISGWEPAMPGICGRT